MLQPDLPVNEAGLIANTRTGSPAALAALYELHAACLFRIAYRLLRSTQDAEDVVHDVFVGLPEALRRYEERGSFPAWLRTVTARVALARLREERARSTVDLDDAGLVSRSGSSDAALTLDAALAALAPGLRAVLVLKEIEGFSHREIASMLGISVGASEVRRHRALRALRNALRKEDKP